MLALSSPLFSSNGWLFDDSMSQQQHLSNVSNESLSPPDQSSLLNYYFSPPSDSGLHQIVGPFDPVTPPPTAASGDPTMVKKLNHNASERDRRRKMNGLFSSLRSLLPSSHQTKKMSIPTTVTRVLKYIPELQEQVQKLAKQKEELIKRIPSPEDDESGPSSTYRGVGPGEKQRINRSTEWSVSVNGLSNEREVAVQISARKDETVRNSFSEMLSNLEMDGISVVNASTFESSGDGSCMVFYTMHVLADQRNDKFPDCDKLKEKVVSFSR